MQVRRSRYTSNQPPLFIQFQNIFNPIMGLRDAQIRAGIKPVNHVKSHAAAIREASQMNALRKLSEQALEEQAVVVAAGKGVQLCCSLGQGD